jgi:hypothetical protein
VLAEEHVTVAMPFSTTHCKGTCSKTLLGTEYVMLIESEGHKHTPVTSVFSITQKKLPSSPRRNEGIVVCKPSIHGTGESMNRDENRKIDHAG